MQVGRRLAGTSLMRSPFSKMSPALGLSMPASMRSTVVLPLPDGPTMVKNSPSRMSRSTASTAATSPNRFVSPRNSRIGDRPETIERSSTTGPGRSSRSATRRFALRGGHDVVQLLVVRHDVVLDRVRHLLLERIPLDRVELLLGEQLEAFRIRHLRDGVEG